MSQAMLDSYGPLAPTASFTGPILGSGLTLLEPDTITTFDDNQRKCCGFVQLASYINPGKWHQTPMAGTHTFQVFVLFPILVQPWSARCAWMTKKESSIFQSGALFCCPSATVVGRLNHATMKTKPPREQDYVLIVVPNEWFFLDMSVYNSPQKTIPRTGSANVTANDRSKNPRSMFRIPRQDSAVGTSTSPITPRKRPNAPDDESPSTPSKTPRLQTPNDAPPSATTLSDDSDTVVVLPAQPSHTTDQSTVTSFSSSSPAMNSIEKESHGRAFHLLTNTTQKPKRAPHPTKKVLDNSSS
jgi:hypothetical protein